MMGAVKGGPAIILRTACRIFWQPPTTCSRATDDYTIAYLSVLPAIV
jgi:hypothetical protein